MSEQTKITSKGTVRARFLSTVSTLALLAPLWASGNARADSDDANYPIVWIELGGQFDILDDGQQKLDPPFFAKIPEAGFASPLALEKNSRTSFDESAKVSFMPDNGDWVLSASVRYGRSGSNAKNHQQTNELLGSHNMHTPSDAKHRYEDGRASSSETHAIFDFMAGKDIGLGSMGSNGTSVLSGGVRFVQFRSQSSIAVYADPDYTRVQQSSNPPQKYFHNYSAMAKNVAGFTGIGPSISWDASAPIGGNAHAGQITLDWGLNGAVLFGRQKSQGFHQTEGKLSTGFSFPLLGFNYNTSHYTHGGPHNRSRIVTVPNLGALAGFSFKYQNAKVSFGYRVDEFFGAMDGGIDAHKNYDFGLSGPFVNVSVGLGG